MTGDADAYVVLVKPSARKVSAGVGEWVNRNGATRRFDSKALAREWARECTGPGRSVWVQDAVPWDPRDVDGYLVGSRRRDGSAPAGAREQVSLVASTHGSERSSGRDGPRTATDPSA